MANIWVQTCEQSIWIKRRKHCVVKFKDDLYLIGGYHDGETGSLNLNDVWKSCDGVNWDCLSQQNQWQGRDGHCVVVHKGFMFLLGGANDPSDNLADVWRSSDGAHWYRLCRRASWIGRWQFGAISYLGCLWVLGGWSENGCLNDVWKSTDGSRWQMVTSSAPWDPRMLFSYCVFNGMLFLMGGRSNRGFTNDVWSSSDGVTWSLVCRSAAWAARAGHTLTVFSGQMHVMGGESSDGTKFNDVWASQDGAHWIQVLESCPWSPRSGHEAVVFRGSLRIYGGHSVSVGDDETLVHHYVNDGYRTSTENDVLLDLEAENVVYDGIYLPPRNSDMNIEDTANHVAEETQKALLKPKLTRTGMPSLVTLVKEMRHQRRLVRGTLQHSKQILRAIKGLHQSEGEVEFATGSTACEVLLEVEHKEEKTKTDVDGKQWLEIQHQSSMDRQNIRNIQVKIQMLKAQQEIDTAGSTENDKKKLALKELLTERECAAAAAEPRAQMIVTYLETTASSLDFKETTLVRCLLEVEQFALDLGIILQTEDEVENQVEDSNGETFGEIEAYFKQKLSEFNLSPDPDSGLEEEFREEKKSSSYGTADAQFEALIAAMQHHMTSGCALKDWLWADTELEVEEGPNKKCSYNLALSWDDVDGSLAKAQAEAHAAVEKEIALLREALDQIRESRKRLLSIGYRELANKLNSVKQHSTDVWLNLEEAQTFLSFVKELANQATMHQKIDYFIQEHHRYQEQLILLEDARIDCRGDLDKKMHRKAPIEEIDQLREQLFKAEQNVRCTKKEHRRFLSQAVAFAHSKAPELFELLPDIVNPTKSTDVDNCSLPVRCIDEYEDVRPIGLPQSLSEKNLGAQKEGASCSKSRHRMFRAVYDDNQVVLKAYTLHDEQQRRDLEREIAILSKLHHDAIIEARALVEAVKVGGAESTVPLFYIEFLYCSFGNLKEWQASQQPNLFTIKSVFRQILCGVMHLHDRGIVHKDIKMQNILVHEDGRILLADFDISKDVTSTFGTTTGVKGRGTPGFMAPEVEQGGSSTFASDMYSLGVLLFWIHFPSHPTGPIAGVPTLPETSDADLVDLLSQLLNVDPLRRPSAANTLLHPYLRSDDILKLEASGDILSQDQKLLAVRDVLRAVRREQRDQHGSDNQSSVTISREPTVLVDQVLTIMQNLHSTSLRKQIKITFEGEAGVDEGGLLSEMYTLLFDSIVLPEIGLFERSGSSDLVTGPAVFLPCSSGTCTDQRTKQKLLSSFERLGRAFVKCLYDGRRIGHKFAPSIFKYLCDCPPNLKDLQVFDPQTASSLQWVLGTTGIKDLGFDFSEVGRPELGAVTDQNKAEYVNLKVAFILNGQRKEFLERIKQGFARALEDISPEASPFLRLLSPNCWRILLCGEELVSAAQIVACLTFTNFAKASKEPAWFVQIINEMSQDNLRRFLIFITGSPSLPAAAVGKIEINIRCQPKSIALPTAHTCFGHVDLPSYGNETMLKKKLLQAINNTASFDRV